MSRVRVEVGHREVKNPFLRGVVVALSLLLLGLVMVVATILLPVALALAALLFGVLLLSIPLHFLLRAFRRRGFVDRNEGSFNFIVSRRGFKKA